MNPIETSTALPDSYGSWKHCITMQCGITITETFIRQRLEELRQPCHSQTQQFIKLYGIAYTQQIIGWFQRALQEISKASV